MPDASQLLADQAVVFQDFPCEPITIGGAEYLCLVLNWTEGNTVEFGGEQQFIPSGTVAIERSTVPVDGNGNVAIAEGAAVTFRGSSFIAGKVDSRDAAASVTIDLMKAEQQ